MVDERRVKTRRDWKRSTPFGWREDEIEESVEQTAKSHRSQNTRAEIERIAAAVDEEG